MSEYAIMLYAFQRVYKYVDTEDEGHNQVIVIGENNQVFEFVDRVFVRSYTTIN